MLKRSIILNEFEKKKDTFKITKYILSSGAIVNDGEDGNSDSLIQAVYNQDKELMEDLLERGANVNSTWQDPNDFTSFMFGRSPKTYTLYDIV